MDSAKPHAQSSQWMVLRISLTSTIAQLSIKQEIKGLHAHNWRYEPLSSDNILALALYEFKA